MNFKHPIFVVLKLLTPNRKTFQSIHQREIRTLKRIGGTGRPMTVRTVELEENVLSIVKEDPIRKIANASSVRNEIIWKVLREYSLN